MVHTSPNGVLGKVVQHAIDKIETLKLAKAPDTVTAICSEVSGLCPVTSQPDLYTVTISYKVIDDQVVESKSLKLYLWKFRDMGISCEELAATIAYELSDQYAEATGKRSTFTVLAKQQSRGGIVLESEATK